MKTNFINYFCAFVVLISAFSCSEDEDPVASENDLTITDQILNLINAHRQGEGLTPLEKNSTAERLAVEHTQYMISQGEISHDNFSGRGDILRDQENATGSAENVASFYPDAASVVEGWINSQGHRNNIEGNYTYTGIAALKDENGNYYYTQLFYR